MTDYVMRNAFAPTRDFNINWPVVTIVSFYGLCLFALISASSGSAFGSDTLLLGP